MLKSKSYIAIPPGATIKEQLEDRGITQKEFAVRMCMSEKHISKLINGEVQLTHEVANRLESVLGVPAKFWNNLESIYREKILKVQEENSMDEDLKIASKLPYRSMVQNGWVKDTNNKADAVVQLRSFFEVANLQALKNPLLNKIACRRLGESEKADYALMVWAQRAKIVARNIETQLINLKKLNSLIPEIRAMTEMNPSKFCPQLKQLLADCGIAIVFLPHIGGSFLHGATFPDGKKIVIGLTVRGKDADRFWFSLFHELGHVLLGHVLQANGTSEADEKAADLFARDTLIDQKSFFEFIARNDFSVNSIKIFSRKIGVASGIVVGRLQKENYIKYNWHNDLKIKYEFA